MSRRARSDGSAARRWPPREMARRARRCVRTDPARPRREHRDVESKVEHSARRARRGGRGDSGARMRHVHYHSPGPSSAPGRAGTRSLPSCTSAAARFHWRRSPRGSPPSAVPGSTLVSARATPLSPPCRQMDGVRTFTESSELQYAAKPSADGLARARALESFVGTRARSRNASAWPFRALRPRPPSGLRSPARPTRPPAPRRSTAPSASRAGARRKSLRGTRPARRSC